MRPQAINTITCGSFTAMPLSGGRFEFTCSWLPDWREVREATMVEASRAVIELQQKNRVAA